VPNLSVKPIPVNASKARVSAFAEDAARRLEFGIGDPIEPLIHRLGGEVIFRTAGPGERFPESIIVESQHKFTIFLPTITSAERDRFTAAHELGHFFLHYPMVQKFHPGEKMIATRWVDEHDETQRRAEWEANWFAAAFLMPAAAFAKIYNEYRNIPYVASRFVVSTQAAEIRAKTLGL